MLNTCTMRVACAAAFLFAGTPQLVAGRANKAKARFEAPVPAQILAAKRIFIPNEGRECVEFDQAGFPGGSNRAYDEFYAAMKRWGRYRIVDAPSKADLVFRFSFTCPSDNAQFRLTILDAKTGIELWGVTEPLQVKPISLTPWSILRSGATKEKVLNMLGAAYEAALRRLISDVKGPARQGRPARK